MPLTALHDDALRSTETGVAIVLSLPWIRSLPLASVRDLTVTIDGDTADIARARLDGRAVELGSLDDDERWWFLQDRLELEVDQTLSSDAHDIAVTFQLTVPYLSAGPDSPLSLPFVVRRSVRLDAGTVPVQAPARTRPASSPRAADDARWPARWALAASAFNWTPDVIRAEHAATEIVTGIPAAGVASLIEIEPGQLWRSYPRTSDAEADSFLADVTAAGGAVSIVGASLDDWLGPTRRRDDDERFAFLLPQLRTARRVGATGVRLPIGQAGAALLSRVLPVLHELDLVLYEEIQGPQSPDAPGIGAALDAIDRLGDERVRVLLDISMLMPGLPPSYLQLLRTGGLPDTLIHRLETEWDDPATHDAVVDTMRSGAVPDRLRTTYMNLLVRFGRSRASDLRGILPLVGAVHLKFWDLDDTDGRISQPLIDIAAELARVGFAGSLCSEWGGHEWLDADATTMTRSHLELARASLSAGAAIADDR